MLTGSEEKWRLYQKTKNTKDDPCRGQPNPGPYSFLAASDPTPIRKGDDADFTDFQKYLVRAANWVLKGGMLRSDDPDDPEQDLVFPPSVSPQQFPKPNAPMNQAEVDHIIPKVKGRTNSLCNARLISKSMNIQKGGN